MKAKVLKEFIDKYNGKTYRVGAVITIPKERFDEILSVDKLIEEVKDKKTAE